MKLWHALRKLLRIVWVLMTAAAEYSRASKPGIENPLELKAAQIAWGSRTARRLADAFGLVIHAEGRAPQKGCLVSNHLGLLDVFTLFSQSPAVFIGKSDIARWPVFGWFATRGGILYIDRLNRGDTAKVVSEMRRCLETGLPVAFFPEGTSSRGEDVLPFRSPLVEAICAGQSPVTAAAICYDDNLLASYAGEDHLIVHLWQLLGRGHIRVRVRYSAPMIFHSGRKQIAQMLHAEVSRLHASLHDEGSTEGGEKTMTTPAVTAAA